LANNSQTRASASASAIEPWERCDRLPAIACERRYLNHQNITIVVSGMEYSSTTAVIIFTKDFPP
jgi:hypothetical protein